VEILEPSPALIVVDMQNGFCRPDGHRSALGLSHESAAAAIEPAGRLLAAARGAGVPVFFTRYVLKPDYSDAGLLVELWPGMKDARALVAGSWSAEIVSELAPRPHEVVVDKNRHSAFFRTDLEERLRDAGVETLVVCGVTTNMCVEGTVRDGFALDFRIVVVANATAAPTAELHERGLKNIAFGFGIVLTVAQAVASFARIRSAVRTPERASQASAC
jgi:ureidoacrylate peracid hydrolase